MIDKNKTYAVVGASDNQEKYGFKVLNDLVQGGYRVFPVNPKGGEILGLKVYSEIKDIPEKVDYVIFVVPPEITKKVLVDILDLGIKDIWLQPGSESQEVIEYCQNNNLNCIHDACIMVERKKN